MMDIDSVSTLKLLSSMYLCEPSAETISAWKSLAAAPGIPDEIRDALNAVDTNFAAVMEDLLWDYTRLFIGPYKLPCPPWESVYTSQKKMMMQDAANEVRRTYAEIGLAVNGTNVMPDHIGVELNFLALVYENADGCNGSQTGWIGIGNAFLHDHLLRWAPQFITEMEMAAETLLYKALAKTTRNLLDLLNARDPISESSC